MCRIVLHNQLHKARHWVTCKGRGLGSTSLVENYLIYPDILYKLIDQNNQYQKT